MEALTRCNLWLRTADRVLLRMGEFEATDFGVLFDHVRALPWEEWIAADGAFPVNGRRSFRNYRVCRRVRKS